MDRRRWLASVAGAALARRRAEAAPDAAMMARYFASRLDPLAQKWRAEIAALRDVDSLRARGRFVQAKELELLGAFPPRTPLAPRVVRVTERTG